ncbi:4Fe-4S cluster-binding domain-containing protein, partial [Thiospirillum jenense]|nr:4Fe-4S cluster-binding domain-containing protein [Thiospirillum jenense]
MSDAELSYSPPAFKQHAVRFSVTEKCNYQCFFCHEEGLAMATARLPAAAQPLRELLVQLKAAGVCDWTFTGGEPLLRQD